MANKAYKFRIYPDAEQKVLFAKTFGCVRFIYNKMLSDKIEYYKLTGEKLNNTPAQYKAEFLWLKEVDSLALANAQMNLQKAYNNFFTNPKKFGFPKFKSKRKSRNSYTTNNQKGSVKIENGYLQLPKTGLVRIKQHRNIPADYQIKSVTVSMTASGKYYASILCEYENQVRQTKLHTFIGLDFSMHELYKDSNGNEPAYPRYYRQSEKIKEKIFCNKQSRQITNAYDCVCIENLDMQAMSQTLHFGKSVSDNGWGMFTEFLRYKLEDAGKMLVKIDRFFASSPDLFLLWLQKSCYKDLSVREWICPECGTHHDRDVNAAINIRNEGMRLVLA